MSEENPIHIDSASSDAQASREGGDSNHHNPNISPEVQEQAPAANDQAIPPAASLIGLLSSSIQGARFTTSPAISAFSFANCFEKDARGPENTRALPKIDSSNLPPSVPGDPLAGGDASRIKPAENKPFSELSASALAKIIGDKISSFKSELWINEDVSGAAFLEVVTPSSFSAFLNETILIRSTFTALRIENLVTKMIRADTTLSLEIRALWAEPMCVVGTPLPPPSQRAPVAPSVLFPAVAESGRAQSKVPSFMSEIRSRTEFTLDDSTIFQLPFERSVAASGSQFFPPIQGTPASFTNKVVVVGWKKC